MHQVKLTREDLIAVDGTNHFLLWLADSDSNVFHCKRRQQFETTAVSIVAGSIRLTSCRKHSASLC